MTRSQPGVAAVTGAGSGMGKALALAFARTGHRVALADVDGRAAFATEEHLRGELPDAITLAAAADVTDFDAVDGWLAASEDALGPLRVLAAVAGVVDGEWTLDSDPESHERVWRVNYLGVLHADIAAARRMRAHEKGGRIVNWSSTAAVGASPAYATYGASKAAVESLTRSLSIELAPHGITVNAIRPGWIDTPINAYLSESAIESAKASVPCGRWGEVDDIVAAALFLASDAAGWITGTCLTVDGGELASAGRFDPAQTEAKLQMHRAWKAALSGRR